MTEFKAQSVADFIVECDKIRDIALSRHSVNKHGREFAAPDSLGALRAVMLKAQLMGYLGKEGGKSLSSEELMKVLVSNWDDLVKVLNANGYDVIKREPTLP